MISEITAPDVLGMLRRIEARGALESAHRTNQTCSHFANDAFKEIIKRENCYVIALDISKFYDSINHEILYKLWCRLLNTNELSGDHLAIFKSVTKYKFVDRKLCYKRLGIAKGQKPKKQLCPPKIFRDKICGKDKSYTSLIEKNRNDYGIPQGIPISDLLANLYMIEFDKCMSEFVNRIGGSFVRYSDDILIICPSIESLPRKIIEYAQELIAKQNLSINESKTNVTEFYSENGKVTWKPYNTEHGNAIKTKKMEYLGFQFNGELK